MNDGQTIDVRVVAASRVHAASAQGMPALVFDVQLTCDEGVEPLPNFAIVDGPTRLRALANEITEQVEYAVQDAGGAMHASREQLADTLRTIPREHVEAALAGFTFGPAVLRTLDGEPGED